MLNVALQDPGHNEHVFAVGQKIASVEEEAAAPRRNRWSQRRCKVIPDTLVPGTSRPDGFGRLGARTPEGRRTVSGSWSQGDPAVTRPGCHGVVDRQRVEFAFNA